MINAKEIILKYYEEGTPLFDSLWTHSQCVKEKALKCASDCGLTFDLDFVKEASLLHDIGIIKCHAPSIHCHGTLPYICHGIEGKKILENEGLYRHALVCERHTGSGLSSSDIIIQNLPLPQHDMLPISLEEQLICYADKFYSKSGEIDKEKSIDQVIRQMEYFGSDSLLRFMTLHKKFGENKSQKI